MIVQFDHQLLSSFYLYLDKSICVDNSGIYVGRTQTFEYSDLDPDTPSDMVAYYGEDRQLSPHGANTGVYVNGNFCGQDLTNGPIIDMEKGRVMFPSGSGQSLEISGSFDLKEFNLYLSNESEEWIVHNRDFNVQGEPFFRTITGDGIARYTLPAIFITNDDGDIEPFALGGEKESKNYIRCVIFANSNYKFEGIKSAIKDLRYATFPVFEYTDFPFGKFFSVRNPPYNYSSFITGHTKLFDAYIENVKVSNLSDVVNRKVGLPNDIKVGFADFEICTFRGAF